MIIRELTLDDATNYLKLLTKLDQETDFMMYEFGERRSSVEDMKKEIDRVLRLNSLMLVIEVNNKLVGYLTAERGFANRIKHSAYITVGILESNRGQGLGKKLFSELIAWSTTNNIVRLELTVMKHNIAGIRLYQKMGFKIEGLKEKSLKVNREFVDEYYMAKIINN